METNLINRGPEIEQEKEDPLFPFLLPSFLPSFPPSFPPSLPPPSSPASFPPPSPLSLLKHCSQPALTMPLAKSFSTFVSLAVVFVFAQRLSTRVVAATRAGHGHDRIAA